LGNNCRIIARVFMQILVKCSMGSRQALTT